MADIPKKRYARPQPASRAARVPYDIADVGDTSPGIRALGEALGEVGETLYLQEANEQFDDARMNTILGFQKLQRNVAGQETKEDGSVKPTPSLEGIQGSYQGFKDELETYAPKNATARRHWHKWVKLQTPGWDEDVKQAMIAKRAIDAEAAITKHKADLLNLVDPNNVVSLGALVDAELTDIKDTRMARGVPEEIAEQESFELRNEWEMKQLGVMAQQNPEGLLELVQKYPDGKFPKETGYRTLHQDPAQIRYLENWAEEQIRDNQRSEAIKAEKWRADALIKLRHRQLTYADVDSAPIPTTGDLGRQEFYNLLHVQAKEAAKGEDIVTDVETESRLEEMAYDIWTGAVSPLQFREALTKARYIDKKIDDSDYDSLASLGAREHKAYQAGAMKDAVSYAQTQLVTTSQSLIEQLIAIVEDDEDQQRTTDMQNRRQLELANLDRYRKALNDWFRANPDADTDEIYKQSRKMLPQYRTKSLSDIRMDRERFESSVSPKDVFKSLLSAPEAGGEIKQARKSSRPGSVARLKDGTEIGTYNPNGSITLNTHAIRLLKQVTRGNKRLARRIIRDYGFVIPEVE